MKKYIAFFLITILFSCEGSDAYQGKWNALNLNGNKFEIIFSPQSFSIKDSIGELKTYKYTQNSIKIENTAEIYGIELEDGRGYQIYFPTKDESIGLILDEKGNEMFTISRKKHITYEELYKLY